MSKGHKTSLSLPVVHQKAAGIDIGSRFHVIAVPPDLCQEPVQTFQAFTTDLQKMAHWLVSLGIETVAMESTGIYWVPVFEMLASVGIEVILANAREAHAGACAAHGRSRGGGGVRLEVLRADRKWVQILRVTLPCSAPLPETASQGIA